MTLKHQFPLMRNLGLMPCLVVAWPNNALKPTVLSPLRYDKTAAELGRWAAVSTTMEIML